MLNACVEGFGAADGDLCASAGLTRGPASWRESKRAFWTRLAVALRVPVSVTGPLDLARLAWEAAICLSEEVRRLVMRGVSVIGLAFRQRIVEDEFRAGGVSA